MPEFTTRPVRRAGVVPGVANPARRNLRAVVLAVIGAVALLFVAPNSAIAHDEFVSSFPEAGSTIGTSPTEITLSFSGELLTEPGSAVMEVLAPGGENIAVDAPDINGQTATQHLSPDPVAGLFTVRWKVVSSDGHPISGEYAYTVEPITMEPVPGSTATAEPTSEPSRTSSGTAEAGGRGRPSGGGELLPVMAVVVGVGVVGGSLIVVLMMGRERRRRDKAAEEG